ncbi:unnamed protein product [Periconia digitata]|uniref:WSC domain-containing protein n=1 Tax=Periconia digitata TaxID=1303443 RepID=A0A9W4UL80_9PLEO|nr:unnamed protein product [Periconia digitata]
MHRQSTYPLTGLFVVVLGLFAFLAKADFDYAYCSNQITVSGNGNSSDYQSNGLCSEFCAGSSFAILLEKNCWCSDYIPGDNQQDINDCGDGCPGYPTEKCGNKDKDLYMYIKLGGTEPSGTQGGLEPTSSAASTTVSPTHTHVSETTVRESKTPVMTPTSRPDEATSSTSTSSESSTPEPTSTFETATSAEPRTSIRTISLSNSVSTETIITTPSATPAPVGSPGQKSTSNTGAIVGGVVGGVVGLAALAGGVFFMLWRRRRQRDAEQDDGQTGMQRNVSTMSRSGLLRSEKRPTNPPPIATNVPRRQSRNLDQESISPTSGSDRRNSRHMVDQRLNPSALFVLDNSSRGSLASMDDSRDYHRPLNVRNPDP